MPSAAFIGRLASQIRDFKPAPNLGMGDWDQHVEMAKAVYSAVRLDLGYDHREVQHGQRVDALHLELRNVVDALARTIGNTFGWGYDGEPITVERALAFPIRTLAKYHRVQIERDGETQIAFRWLNRDDEG